MVGCFPDYKLFCSSFENDMCYVTHKHKPAATSATKHVGFNKTEFKLENCQYWNRLGKQSRLTGTTVTAHNFTEEIDHYK